MNGPTEDSVGRSRSEAEGRARRKDSPASTRPQELYEAMRQRWLGGEEDEALGSSRAGLAVLLRQGVAAWDRACSLSFPRAEASTGAVPAAPEATRGGGTLFPEPSRAELARVLATMVWAAAEGATRCTSRRSTKSPRST